LVNRGNYRNDFYLYHVALTDGQYLLLTDKNILKVEPARIEAVEGRFISSFSYSQKGKGPEKKIQNIF
jgi:hypothetical protein